MSTPAILDDIVKLRGKLIASKLGDDVPTDSMAGEQVMATYVLAAAVLRLVDMLEEVGRKE